LQLLDKNNLLVNNKAIGDSMMFRYITNKKMIKESFAAFEQQNTNYIFYVFRKLGLLDTGMDKQNHLTIF
jgi:hypothetical protein